MSEMGNECKEKKTLFQTAIQISKEILKNNNPTKTTLKRKNTFQDLEIRLHKHQSVFTVELLGFFIFELPFVYFSKCLANTDSFILIQLFLYFKYMHR